MNLVEVHNLKENQAGQIFQNRPCVQYTASRKLYDFMHTSMNPGPPFGDHRDELRSASQWFQSALNCHRINKERFREVKDIMCKMMEPHLKMRFAPVSLIRPPCP